MSARNFCSRGVGHGGHKAGTRMCGKLEKVSHAAHESPFAKLSANTDATHNCMVAMEAVLTAHAVHCVGGVEQRMKPLPTFFVSVKFWLHSDMCIWAPSWSQRTSGV
jgi:hypothetical protein